MAKSKCAIQFDSVNTGLGRNLDLRFSTQHQFTKQAFSCSDDCEVDAYRFVVSFFDETHVATGGSRVVGSCFSRATVWRDR